MKRAIKLFPAAFYLAGLIAGLGAGTARGADISISIFGNLGPSGFEEPWYDRGGGYITPPYRDDDRGDRHDDRERRAAPERRDDRRAIPSIPNNRRPESRRQDSRSGSRDQRR